MTLGICASAGFACAGDTVSDASGDLTSVDAKVEVIVSEAEVAGEFVPPAESFVADESAVYWCDSRGAVFARRARGPELVQLRPPLARPEGEYFLEFPIGMAGDEERLFLGQAFLQTGVTDFFPLTFEPPGRLVVIPKDGSPATVVVELEDATIRPIASDATRLIVIVQGGSDPGFYQLIRSSLELERLPVRAPLDSMYSGDTLYWSSGFDEMELFRSRFDDAEPVRVGEMEGYQIDVGPGYALTRQDRLVEPDYAIEQNFVLHDAATGDERPLPGMGEAISIETSLDVRHAYWFSYPGGRPGGLPPTDPRFRLARVDIRSGALTVLNTPGLRLEPSARMIGQTPDRLFIENAGQIVAVEKP